MASLFVLSANAFDTKELAKRQNNGSEKPTMEYKVPDEKTIPNNAYGDMVRYGKELIVSYL